MPNKTSTCRALVPLERIQQVIYLLRGHKVILDTDIAELYGVQIRALTQAVKRNSGRFPPDFMFQLTWPEARALRSQFVILEGADDAPGAPLGPPGRGQHRKYRPYAFTEQGVAMLSSVLRSERAVRVNIEIMRAFVRLRSILASHADLVRKLEALEGKYDRQFKVVFDAIRQLMTEPESAPKPPIGYATEDGHATPRGRLRRRTPQPHR